MMEPGKTYLMLEPSINKRMGWWMPAGVKFVCLIRASRTRAWVTLPGGAIAFLVQDTGRHALVYREGEQ